MPFPGGGSRIFSAANEAAFLKSRGFSADVVLDAEPELPIAFVVTNVLVGTVINFRKQDRAHVAALVAGSSS